MNKIFKLISVFIILLLAVSSAFAGGGKSGQGLLVHPKLLIPVGPRGIAMGESNLLTASGIEALFWNPAGVSHMTNNADVMFSYMDYIADIGVQKHAIWEGETLFEGFGAVSFAVKSLSVGDILVTTTSTPDGDTL